MHECRRELGLVNFRLEMIEDKSSPAVSSLTSFLLLEDVMDSLPKLVEALETDRGCKVIVDLRQDLAFEPLHRDGVGDGLSSLVFVLEIIGKRLRGDTLITDLCALKSLVDFRRHRV